ncbi:hypothetical protein ERJ75_000352400 [Trypanosoma vivax]|uniref:Transmembrane protein n=1 Tax=Trypanosoma vivax (strain Y486) TaxID=1055687 RepID=G0TZP2_TRYVY|nr:hypothetical protein TRVL_04738 [Trypanosoma vivax]KAH8617680.1 hypothetical protein ERJ75_000352400 [Trypanosoma vivax]CCC50070.1 conserved hypothetical protein [Trypanosoma vivax Y486]
MEESFALLLSTIVLIAFFAFDFFFARLLNMLKQDHPELEECTPEGAPDIDPVAAIDSLKQTAIEMYDYQQQRFGFRDGKIITGVSTSSHPCEGTTTYGTDETTSPPLASQRKTGSALHFVVVVCGFAAPIVTVLQLLWAGAFGWCRFSLPSWIEYVGAFTGLAGVFLYAARVSHCSRFSEVSRQQWLALMWFRLDFMCIVSVAAFLGAGAWVVSLCLLVVGFYLAHRVMRIEKRFNMLQRETQLVRGEVDLEHVHVPGTKEAARALASSDVRGYNALS